MDGRRGMTIMHNGKQMQCKEKRCRNEMMTTKIQRKTLQARKKKRESGRIIGIWMQ